MKKRIILPFAAGLMLLTACTGEGGGTMPTNATAADSLMYYLGELNGATYKGMAARDTTLDTEAARAAYIAGVKAGINLPKDEDAAYNQGLKEGVQMAEAIFQVQKEYGVTLDKRVYLSSLTATVNSDSIINQAIPQQEFTRIFDQMKKDKEEKDKAAARETLSQAIAGKDYTKITDDLYGKIKEKNDSAEIQNNDLVNLDIQVKTLEDKDLRLPLPRSARVGAPNCPEVITDALLKQRSGEEGEYYTTAQALLGSRASQFELEPSTVLCFTLKASVRPVEKREVSLKDDTSVTKKDITKKDDIKKVDKKPELKAVPATSATSKKPEKR